MKKHLIFGVVLAMALTSCQKENLNNQGCDAGGRTILLNVVGNEWTADGKTAYTPGTGVALTGEELIKLYYDDNGTYVAAGKATPTGTAGQYSFTVPEGVEDGTQFYAMMPFSNAVYGLNGAKTSVTLRLGPVQHPEANSYDPHFDYLVGKPFILDGATAEISSFKRLFAPLRINITGLPQGDKIYSATVSLDQAPEKDKNQALQGMYYVVMGSEYADTRVNGTEPNAMGNAVSAVYAAGLADNSGTWPVWLMVNPITIKSGTGMTITVSTTSGTYTRVVSWPSDKDIKSDKLNEFGFSFNEVNTPAESVTFNFTASASLNGSATLAGSNGSSVNWTFSGNVLYDAVAKDEGSGLKNAMVLNGKSFGFPSINGKKIIGAVVYTHVATAKDGTLILKDGDNALAEYPFTAISASGNLFALGGKIEIALPEGKESLTGLKLEGNAKNNLITAVTLYTADGGQTGPEEATGSDYYQEFVDGKKITINGVAYHKDTHPTYDLVTLGKETAAQEINKAGIHFIDDSQYPDGFNNSNNFSFPNGTVLIGRKANHQPKISTDKQFQISANTVFKNIELYSANKSASITDKDAASAPSFVMEDCTFKSNVDASFIREVQGNISFKEIVVNNSVLMAAGKLYDLKTSTATQLESVTIKNSVVFVASSSSVKMFDVTGASYSTPSLFITLSNNTFYNFVGTPAFGVKTAMSVKMDNNIWAGELPQNINMYVQNDENSLVKSYIKGNYGYSSVDDYSWNAASHATIINAGGDGKLVVSDNTYSNTNPFISEDMAAGYFPVNIGVVTNGAGARYDTKVWRDWGGTKSSLPSSSESIASRSGSWE